MKKTILLSAIAVIIIAVLVLSVFNTDYIESGSTFALDTYIEIKIYDNYLPRQDKNSSYIDNSFDLINNLENTLSVYKENSDTYNIKVNAGQSAAEVEDITFNIIEESKYFYDITDGLFDITSGPLIDLWDIDPPNGHVPTDEELAYVLPLIDYNEITMSVNGIMLNNEGMIINLGAIAKGAIADEVKEYLVSQGVKSAIINLGGNVINIGNKIDGTDFKVGVQNPFDERNAYIMSLPVNDMAVVTSGDYERYFEEDGIIYHHILNTETGYPADNNIKQVTIIAPTSIFADGLSTSVLLLGLEKGIELINQQENTEAVFVTKDKKIYITSGLTDVYEVDSEQISSFTIVDTVDELLAD